MKKTLNTLAILVLLSICTPVLPVEAAPAEIVGLRTQYSNTYLNSNGLLVTRLYLGSVNYETPAGNFRPIQTNVVSSSKAGWDWEVESGHWQLYIRNDMTVRVVKDDNTIGHRFYGIAYRETASNKFEIIQTVVNQNPSVDGNKLTWENVLYGVDYRLTYTNDSLKEDVVIHQELRDLINTAGNTPADYGLDNTAQLVAVYIMDWSNSLPMKIKTDKNKDGKADRGFNGKLILESVNTSDSRQIQNIYFQSSKKDRYFDTDLVSYFPLDFATSVNPTNPGDLEREWVYAFEPIQKWFTKKSGIDYLLTGISMDTLNQMPEGSIIFDPTETLRPSGAGDTTELTPIGGANWQCVDEVIPDDSSSYVVNDTGGDTPTWEKDLYNLPASAGNGTINKVNVYFRAKRGGGAGKAKAEIKSDGVEDTGSEVDPGQNYTTKSAEWTEDPATDAAWIWDAIDALQIGVSLKYHVESTYCTQVYVAVTYTAPALPTVATQAVTGTDNISTTGHGTIVSSYENCDFRGFVWDTSSHGDPGDTAPPSTYSDNITVSGNFTEETFMGSITGLTPGTPYYVRAHAHNSVGWSYGEEVSFTTDTTPTITVNAATNVAYTTARLNSTLTDDGGDTCEVRFQYNTTDSWTLADYTDNTTWVDSYTTGQYPYADIDTLISNTLYYCRAQALNDYGTANSTSTSFTTGNVIREPTNLTAFPTAVSVILSWTRGAGSTNTLIRYKEGSYPADETDGTQAYLGTSSSHAITSLTPGHTYYISAWGESGLTYSDNYTTVMATTTAAAAADEDIEAPSMPTRWFQFPDPTKFSKMPFYVVVNLFMDSLEVPRSSGWFGLAILGCLVFGLIAFLFGKHPMPALIATAFALCVLSLAGLLPMFMMLFAIMFFLGAWQFRGGIG